MIKVVSQGIKLNIPAHKTIIDQTGCKLGILPPPADKLLIKAVNGNSILAPEGKITGPDSAQISVFK